jgi:hypothetical protein
VKCDKCGHISFEHNETCPSCGKDLTVARTRLGIYLKPPRTTLDVFFSQDSGAYRSASYATTQTRPAKDEAELEMDTGKDELDFTLDD